MAGNQWGKAYTFQTFGESHGSCIGCIIDGIPPNIPLREEDIQDFLNERRPGQSKYTTQRTERDQVRIVSGMFQGKTTGTPLALLVENEDVRSKDYGDIAQKFRPGHADYTYFKKYGIYDYRGGGRASARETAMRVAAGAVAQKILDHLGFEIKVKAAVTRIGSQCIDFLGQLSEKAYDIARSNVLFCPEQEKLSVWEDYLKNVRKRGTSCGALIQCTIYGVPVGLGEPVYDRLDADLAKAMMSINAVKGIEFGIGFQGASLEGHETNDEMLLENERVGFASNFSGGILGGISSGQEIYFNVAFKPTSSIAMRQKTLTYDFQETDIFVKGRHDPCVGIRGVPVVEAMGRCVILDNILRV